MGIKIILRALLIILLTAMSLDAIAADVSFIGREGQAWYPYIVSKKTITKIAGIDNPRCVAVSSRRHEIAYEDGFGVIHLHSLSSHNSKHDLIIQPGKDLYMDLAYNQSGTELYAIRFKGGNESASDLMRFDRKDNKFERIHRQKGLLYDPEIIKNNVIYSVASCTRGCDPKIQDVWYINTYNNHAMQLTRNNVISGNAQFYPNSKSILYISSTERKHQVKMYRFKYDRSNEIKYTGDDIEQLAIGRSNRIYVSARSTKDRSIILLEVALNHDRLVDKYKLDLGKIADIRDLESAYGNAN